MKLRQEIIWLTIAYVLVIGVALYPGLHERFARTVVFWNCVPPTVGFALIITALQKSKRRVIASAVFALVTAAVAIFFFGAWFFTSLDTDPHSASTTLVFVCAPLLSLILATVVSGLSWLATRNSGLRT
jgi:hypothetical protein